MIAMHDPAPDLQVFGITRVGDLTDLDILGIPVWFAVRPNARSLSVSQGKGLTHEQARISAVMEAVEGAYAEQTRALVSEVCTPSELEARGHRLLPLHDIAHCKFASFDGQVERAWVRGLNFATGESIFAPYELVGLDMRPAFPWDHKAFLVSSTGLAAGPDFAFASLNALLELVERDAIVPIERFGLQCDFAKPVRWQANINRGLDEAVAKVGAAGLTPYFFSIVSSTGLPVVAAVVTRPVLHAQGGGHRLSGGFSCRLDVGEAALSALLEAVQSRLTNIAGSRDDMDASQYEDGGDFAPLSEDGAIELSALAVQHQAVPDLSHAQKLDRVVSALSASGHPDVFLFDLPGPVPDIHVVRAIVPGLKAFLGEESV